MFDGELFVAEPSQAPAAGRSAVALIAEAIRELNPTWLNLSQSEVTFDQDLTEIALVHTQSRQGDLYIVVQASGWTQFYGPHGYQEIYGDGPSDPEWVTALRNRTKDLLSATFQSVKTTAARPVQ